MPFESDSSIDAGDVALIIRADLSRVERDLQFLEKRDIKIAPRFDRNAFERELRQTKPLTLTAQVDTQRAKAKIAGLSKEKIEIQADVVQGSFGRDAVFGNSGSDAFVFPSDRTESEREVAEIEALERGYRAQNTSVAAREDLLARTGQVAEDLLVLAEQQIEFDRATKKRLDSLEKLENLKRLFSDGTVERPLRENSDYETVRSFVVDTFDSSFGGELRKTAEGAQRKAYENSLDFWVEDFGKKAEATGRYFLEVVREVWGKSNSDGIQINSGSNLPSALAAFEGDQRRALIEQIDFMFLRVQSAVQSATRDIFNSLSAPNGVGEGELFSDALKSLNEELATSKFGLESWIGTAEKHIATQNLAAFAADEFAKSQERVSKVSLGYQVAAQQFDSLKASIDAFEKQFDLPDFQRQLEDFGVENPLDVRAVDDALERASDRDDDGAFVKELAAYREYLGLRDKLQAAEVVKLEAHLKARREIERAELGKMKDFRKDALADIKIQQNTDLLQVRRFGRPEEDVAADTARIEARSAEERLKQAELFAATLARQQKEGIISAETFAEQEKQIVVEVSQLKLGLLDAENAARQALAQKALANLERDREIAEKNLALGQTQTNIKAQQILGAAPLGDPSARGQAETLRLESELAAKQQQRALAEKQLGELQNLRKQGLLAENDFERRNLDIKQQLKQTSLEELQIAQQQRELQKQTAEEEMRHELEMLRLRGERSQVQGSIGNLSGRVAGGLDSFGGRLQAQRGDALLEADAFNNQRGQIETQLQHLQQLKSEGLIAIEEFRERSLALQNELGGAMRDRLQSVIQLYDSLGQREKELQKELLQSRQELASGIADAQISGLESVAGLLDGAFDFASSEREVQSLVGQRLQLEERIAEIKERSLQKELQARQQIAALERREALQRAQEEISQAEAALAAARKAREGDASRQRASQKTLELLQKHGGGQLSKEFEQRLLGDANPQSQAEVSAAQQSLSQARENFELQKEINQLAEERLQVEQSISLVQQQFESIRSSYDAQIEAAKRLSDIQAQSLEREREMRQQIFDVHAAEADLSSARLEVEASQLERALQLRKQLDSGAASFEISKELRKQLGELGAAGLGTIAILERQRQQQQEIAAERASQLQAEQALKQELLGLQLEEQKARAEAIAQEKELRALQADQLLLEAQNSLTTAQNPQQKGILEELVSNLRQQAAAARDALSGGGNEIQRQEQLASLQQQALNATQERARIELESSNALQDQAAALEVAEEKARKIAEARERAIELQRQETSTAGAVSDLKIARLQVDSSELERALQLRNQLDGGATGGVARELRGQLQSLGAGGLNSVKLLQRQRSIQREIAAERLKQLETEQALARELLDIEVRQSAIKQQALAREQELVALQVERNLLETERDLVGASTDAERDSLRQILDNLQQQSSAARAAAAEGEALAKQQERLASLKETELAATQERARIELKSSSALQDQAEALEIAEARAKGVADQQERAADAAERQVAATEQANRSRVFTQNLDIQNIALRAAGGDGILSDEERVRAAIEATRRGTIDEGAIADFAGEFATIARELGNRIDGLSVLDRVVRDAERQDIPIVDALGELGNRIEGSLRENLSRFGEGIALPAFKDGGLPQVGRAALVGEQGPELFVPTVPGRVYTARQTKDILSKSDRARLAALQRREQQARTTSPQQSQQGTSTAAAVSDRGRGDGQDVVELQREVRSLQRALVPLLKKIAASTQRTANQPTVAIENVNVDPDRGEDLELINKLMEVWGDR